MKKILIVFLLVLAAFSLVAEQGQYIRKSVSSVESIWMKPGSGYMNDKERDFFDMMFKFYVEIPRFDFNTLPPAVITKFVDESNKISTVNANTLASVMEKTVALEINKLLNDPEIQKARADGFKDEAAYMSFAATKGKSYGLSGEELAAFMNSAFIYLPFVSSVSEKVADDLIVKNKQNYTYTINGGILWYKVGVAPDGSVNVSLVKSISTSSFGSSRVPDEGKEKETSVFTFGNFRESVEYKTAAKYNAMLAFAKNLGVKTKEIDDFKLQAQVISIEKGKLAGDIGYKEGVRLDDGYYVCEATETSDGKTRLVKKGFTRVWKTGQNQKDPAAMTLFNKHYGKSDIGMVLMEHPRLGIDFQFQMGVLAGMNVPKTIKWGMDEFGYDLGQTTFFKEDLADATIYEISLKNNVASVFGARQLFFDLGGYMGTPSAEVETNAGWEKDDFTTSIAGVYLGFTKKIWMGRFGLNYGAQGSYDMLTIDFGKDVYENEYKIDISTIGIKGFMGAEWMLGADFYLDMQLGYKYTLEPLKAEYSYGTDTLEIPMEDNDLSLGGINAYFGFTYALASLPFNLFGSMDTMRKY
jgi:hypothetical protein